MRCKVSCVRCPVSGVSGVKWQVSVVSCQERGVRCLPYGVRWKVPENRSQVACFRIQEPGTRWYKVSGVMCHVLGVRHQVSGNTCHVSEVSGFRFEGSGVRC